MAVSEEESSSGSSKSRSISSSSAVAGNSETYYLAKCALPGSVVLQVVHGHLRSPSSNDVVFGKETTIELVVIDDDGVVQSICEQPVFGTIKNIALLPWNEILHSQIPQMRGKDLLIVLSDSGKLSFLTFSNEMHRFFPLTQILLSTLPGNLSPQVGWMLAVESNGCFIAASTHLDQLALFSVSQHHTTDIIDKRLIYPPEDGRLQGTIWSMCFISRDVCLPIKEHNPVLAVLLNRRGSHLNELLLMEWDTGENAVHVISQYADYGALAHKIVEVPHSYGFAFLFRAGDILLMDLRDAHNPCCVYRTSLTFIPTVVEEQNFVDESSRANDIDEEGNMFNDAASALLKLSYMMKDGDPMNIDDDSGHMIATACHVCAWSWEPQNKENPRMIYCLDTGELFMIEISSDSTGIKVNQSDCLYKSLPLKELLWVEGGFLVAVVEMGDGMVLKVEDGRLLFKSPVQNIAPILDMSVVDYNEEKHEQMFACCGVAPEGSLRIIRNGISVDKLLKTAPIYAGITGTWTVKMKVTDRYHSFLVLSFVEETRVLSVGVSFTDVTDLVGFQPDVCTLACGLVCDGLLVQIHQNAVRVCLPTIVAHPEGISHPSPICTSWSPDNMSISLGAVGHNLIVVATSNPCSLFVLGVRPVSSFQYEIYLMQHTRLQNELSCVSIPQTHFPRKPSSSHSSSTDSSLTSLQVGIETGNTIVIGTHRPSVEVLSFIPEKGIKVLAIGTISLINNMGATITGSVPQDVRLVQVDRPYILTGLRNGMLLRFEWPSVSAVPILEQTSMRPYHNAANFFTAAPAHNVSPLSALIEKTKDIPVHLQLIAVRRIGITPAFLVPLNDFLDADIIALSDRPWLLQSARHSLTYTSISFQSSTNATPVCSSECPKGILFVAENSLHLVEMVHSKRLNVQKFHLGGTPRKVLYHSESRLLLVMRTELSNDSSSSDICCVDPLSGSILSSFKLDPGETGKCMELVNVGNDQVLLVGTSRSDGPAIMPSGEAESTKGRLIVLCIEHKQNSDTGSMTFCSKAGSSSQRTSPFREIIGYGAEQFSSSSLCSSPDDSSDGIKLEETEAWILRLSYSTSWPGMVVAICPYLGRYFLVSAGNSFYVCGFPNDNFQRVKKLAVGRTRHMIMTLTAHVTRIAVGDCRDGILFYSYHEDSRKLEQLYSDPVRRLVADCMLMDVDTAVVTDRKGSISVLSCSHHSEDNASPECNLKLSSSYYMGEIAMSIRKGSFSYKLPADDVLRGCHVGSAITDLSQSSIVASTLLGSIIIFIPISRDEYELLEAVQARLVVHPLTAPILGNDHNEFRSRESRANVPKILDGDMLAQFLELTSMQQEAVLGLPLGSPNTVMLSKPSLAPITVNQVVRLLERVHYALN